MVHDVQNILSLGIGGDFAPSEIVRENGSIHELSKDFRDALHRDIANPSFADHRLIEIPPALDIVFSMLEIRGFFSVSKLGPFLDQEFHGAGIVREELQIRPNRRLNLSERIFDAIATGINLIAKPCMTWSTAARNSSSLLLKYR